MQLREARRLTFVGTWDLPKLRGADAIVVCAEDPETAELTALGSALPGVSVGALHVDKVRNVLYVLDEDTRHEPFRVGGGGSVIALRIEPATGELTEFSRSPSFGSLPSYLAVTGSGRHLVVTNHTSSTPITEVVGTPGDYRIEARYDLATVVLFPLADDGSIGAPLDVYVHPGPPGPRPGQTHSRPHCVLAAPSGNFLVICDKGTDRIVTVAVDEQAGRFRSRNGDGYPAPPGSSPRYAAFHPTGPFLFVNHEAEPIVSAFRYDEAGALSLVCTVSAVAPESSAGVEARQSDVRVHPSGRFLYSLIRGLDAVSVFAIDPGTGSLERLATVPAGGVGPRGCLLSVDGRHLHLATVDSDAVITWAIGADGLLTVSGSRLLTPGPGALARW